MADNHDPITLADLTLIDRTTGMALPPGVEVEFESEEVAAKVTWEAAAELQAAAANPTEYESGYLAPPDVLRAAADAADDAICRSLDHHQATALIADAVWRIAHERGHAEGLREAGVAAQRPHQLAYERGLSEGRRQAAAAIRAADTSTWPGGRASDVNACQEAAAGIAEEHHGR